MLVLSRKVGQDVLIGDRVRVRVVNATRGTVRLAFSAPPDVGVLRAELAKHCRNPARPVQPPLASSERNGESQCP
jgi:carbon storage regulator